MLIFQYAAELSTKVLALKSAVAPDGMVWVVWPKRASKMPTDLTENVIREIVLPTGLVDVKVCAIDQTWSGLKLVIRGRFVDDLVHPAGLPSGGNLQRGDRLVGVVAHQQRHFTARDVEGQNPRVLCPSASSPTPSARRETPASATSNNSPV